MRKNLVCNFDREDEKTAYVHGNAKSEALKDPLEDFFEQIKEKEDTKVKTNDGDNEVEDEDKDDSQF